MAGCIVAFVRFSLELPTTRVESPEVFVTASAIAEVTSAAVAAGFDAVNVTDHPAPDSSWLDHGGHHALDPMVALAFAAAADPDVLLHTNVFIPAYRNPFLAAKQVQTLDVLSGGRLLLGVAAGYLKPEFAALGVDFETRGARLDDTLDVITSALTGEDLERSGPTYTARGVRLRPVRPRGAPPIWVGGNSRAAMRRAARHDGWAPFNTSGYAKASRTAAIETASDLAAAIREVRGMAGADGPDSDRRFDICWSDATLSDPQLGADALCAKVGEMAGAGVTWTVFSPTHPDRAGFIERIREFGHTVITEFAEESPWR
jgi:probable F420-dependent oxidoreductase